MSLVAPIHWHEGMFLRPQHFQVAEQNFAALLRNNIEWSYHHRWGIRRIQLDEKALANHRVVIDELAIRMRDGTLFSAPESGSLPELDLRSAMQSRSSLTLWLGIPKREASGSDQASRYRVESCDLEDANTGQNPRPIQIRRLNARLLSDADDQAGYATLPIVRLKRADHAEGAPEIDRAYIPPLLSVDAWPILERDILRPVFDRIGKKLELVSNQVVSRGITFDSSSQGDRVLLEQMRVMNETYAELSVRAFLAGVHPSELFVSLANFVGRMAVFTPARRVPELSRYDHDDLGTCFWSLRRLVDQMLDAVVEPEYSERAFRGAGQRIQVALEPGWLESGQRLFVAVTSPLASEQTRSLVERRIDMKIGSGSTVDELYRQGRAGLRFTHQADPPRCLPLRPGRVFFGIDTAHPEDQWQLVQQSLSLAIRFNENLISGDIQGRQAIDVKIDGQATTLEFVLYVVPPSAL